MLLSVSMSDLQKKKKKKKYSRSYYTCNGNREHVQLLELCYCPSPLSFTGSHFTAKTIIIYYKLTLDWV